jgi:hypothetical protein
MRACACVDVRMTSGSGELKFSAEPTCVFKRNVDVIYALRSPAARAALGDIKTHFPTFVFALRQLSDQRTARLGAKEMLTHSMLESFDVTVDKRPKDAVIACVRFTVVISGGRTQSLTPLPVPTLPDGFTLSPHTSYVLALDVDNHNAPYSPPADVLAPAASSVSQSSAQASSSMATD